MRKLSVRRRIQAIRNLPDICINAGKKVPFVRKLFFSNRGEYPILKAIAGFFFGTVLGVFFYQVVIKELEFSSATAIVLSIVVSLMLAVGCAVSSQMRCTCILTFPAFCGKSGRGALKALVIAYIVAGPVHNIVVNSKEVVRTFACSTTLTYNLTKTKFVLMFKPFKDALMSAKADTSEVKETLNTVREVAAPIVSEMRDTEELEFSKELNDYIDDAQNTTRRTEKTDNKYDTSNSKDKNKNIEDEYFKKLEYRCEDDYGALHRKLQFTKCKGIGKIKRLKRGVMSAAGAKCRNIFAKSYDDCYNTVSWMAAWALCWPMQLTFVCDIVQVLGGDNACDATQEITPGFGKAYNYLIDSRNMVASEFRPPRIQYRISRPQIPIDVRGAADTAQAVLKEFQEKKSFVDSIMIIVKRILALVFVRIIISAQSYQEQYIKNIEFDNCYITKYFRKIDARRKAVEKATLLPLKKIEAPKFIDPFSLVLFKKERSKIMDHSIKISLEMMTASAIIFLSRMYYTSLDLVRRHGKIEYHQSGYHDLNITVKGKGMVATVVKSIVRSFNFRQRIDQNYTNECELCDCLPRPKRLETKTIKAIYGVYIIIYVLIIFEGYVMRMRRLICSYFYPKREKKRTLFLYNETLKQRIAYYRYMQKRAKKMIRDNKIIQDVSFLLMLSLKFPRQLKWLKWFSSCRRKCLICGEVESRTREDIYECPNCLYIYCLECWLDIGKSCYVCSPPTSDEDSADEPQPADD